MDDNDLEIEDFADLVSLFDDPDVTAELETPVDLSDSSADFLEDQFYEYDQELMKRVSIESVLAQLEGFALNLVEQLQREELPIQFNLVKQRNIRRTLRWPTKSGSIKEIARLFRVIELVQEAIICGIPITKREIFYRDVTLFRNQSVVNKLVELIAHTFEVPRKSLNVRASAKGLFCGSGLKIGLSSGGIIHGSDSEGFLIPPSEEIAWLSVSENVSWVLVIEKEAVFQTLVKGSFVMGMHPLDPGLLITGKGYPDFATLELTRQLSLILPKSVPIGAIVDCDPYGLDILSMYKYGRGLANREERFATPNIKWLGVWTSEVSRINSDNLLPLTEHDVKKCLQMLTRYSRDMPLQWKRELSRMLFNHRKAEIEALLSPSNQIQSSLTESGLSSLLHYLLEKVKDLIVVNQECVLH